MEIGRTIPAAGRGHRVEGEVMRGMTEAEKQQRMDEINSICKVLSEKESANMAEIKRQKEIVSKAALKIADLQTEGQELREQLTDLHKEYMELARSKKQAS